MFVFIAYLVAKKLVELMFVCGFYCFSIGIETEAIDIRHASSIQPQPAIRPLIFQTI